MKKLSITKESFEKSKYFTNKYGKLEYVSESGKVFKTSKGKMLKFKESDERKECRHNIIRAYDSLEQALREYMSILEGSQLKQARKVEAKIHDLIADFLADTSTSYGGVDKPISDDI